MPLANGLVAEQDLGKPEERYPLALAFCLHCSLAQITEVVSPEKLFRDYAYYSSISDEMVEHARQASRRAIEGRRLGNDSLVVEIASNDGYLLRHYVEHGIPVLGIDPARNIAEAASANGVPTIAEFFNVGLAKELRRSGRLADVVHANNVLAHVPDIHGFIAGIESILKPRGVAIVETPYVRDMVERSEFDTIYHEHVFYYSLSSLTRLLAGHGLVVLNVERIPIHGGSLRLLIGRERELAPEPSVAALLYEETALGLAGPEYFDEFASHVRAIGDDLRQMLSSMKRGGRRVAAYGAAAKGAVLLNAFGIGAETIDFVVDRSPHKQGRYMPGVHIPIRAPDLLLHEMPDACLLLAWNFADEIIRQQADYVARGGQFIVPIPEPRLLPGAPAAAMAAGGAP